MFSFFFILFFLLLGTLRLPRVDDFPRPMDSEVLAFRTNALTGLAEPADGGRLRDEPEPIAR